MRHGHNGAMIFLQVALQPGHRLGVEMVGRFVHQQQIGFLKEDFA